MTHALRDDFRPMLAARERPDLTTLRYPVFVSPKLDGVRCIIRDGRIVSRKLIDIPNLHICTKLRPLTHASLAGLDGELMAGENFSQVQSAVMSQGGRPKFKFMIFDCFHPKVLAMPYHDRYMHLLEAAKTIGTLAPAEVLHQIVAHSPDEVLELEQRFVERGYEGAIIRDPLSPYKYGRSTLREGYMLKLKQFETDEAEIVGFEELLHNENEQVADNLGKSKRSSHAANMRPGGTLGALHVIRCSDGQSFSIGSGFTAAQRAQLWRKRSTLIGRIVTFKHQPTPGYDKPRMPIFLGFRDKRDI